MVIQDVIAIATFAIAILGVVYAFGVRDSKLSQLEKDLNSLGKKIDQEITDIYKELKSFDKRADSQSIFLVAIDQRVRQLQETFLGMERTERLRETPKTDRHYTTEDDRWYSENSGIEL